ncbi:hypothetical protein LN042_25775 [Kitasatospora sp. RB6PN24]|uniref:hypothetical protein n=1 Tax=Kitasatospora humi TaxID=2893891 RepID=UPI001E5F4CFA|nr:hypothetical protein [Kitasatospora humi]MCC9310436.1 hypothetical protein [Kitasatospora humi]
MVLTGDEDEDRERMRQAAPGPIDCVLDIMPPTAATSQVRAAAMAVRNSGRVVLMGGIRNDLTLPYAWLMNNNITLRGQFMYPREANVRMVELLRSGLLDLNAFEVTEFPLDEANGAIAFAAANGGPFHLTVIRP